ncbi:mucin-2-like isoform X1 [Saccostrea cucullata]|uniref:mucin-2-like isoform X1 n=1 Tax=Saccostrea cuccullata TaxID=36930 RepID=UPI002ED0D788
MMINISQLLIIWISILGLTVSSSSQTRFSQNAQSKFRRSIFNFHLHKDGHKSTPFTPVPFSQNNVSFGASQRHTTTSSLILSRLSSLSGPRTSGSTSTRSSFANTLKVKASSSLLAISQPSVTSPIPSNTFNSQTDYFTASTPPKSKVSSTHNMKIQRTESFPTLTFVRKNFTSSTLKTIESSNALSHSTVWKTSIPNQASSKYIAKPSSILHETTMLSTTLTSKPSNDLKTTTRMNFQNITTQKTSGKTPTKTVSSKTTLTETILTMLSFSTTKSTDQSKLLTTIKSLITKSTIRTTKEPSKIATPKIPSSTMTPISIVVTSKTTTPKSPFLTKAIQTTMEPPKTTTTKAPFFTKTTSPLKTEASKTTTTKSLPLSKTTIHIKTEPSKTTTTKSPILTEATMQTTTGPSKVITPKIPPSTKTTIQTTVESKTLIPTSSSSIKATPSTTYKSHLSTTISSKSSIHISAPSTSNEMPISGSGITTKASTLRSSFKTSTHTTVHKTTLPIQTIQSSTVHATPKSTSSTSAIGSTTAQLIESTTVSPSHRTSTTLKPSTGSYSGTSPRFTGTTPVASSSGISKTQKSPTTVYGHSNSIHHTNDIYTTEMAVSSTPDNSLSNKIPQRTGLSKRSIGAIAAACTIVGCVGIILGLYVFVSKRFKSGEKSWAVVDDHTRIETIDMSEKMDSVLHDFDQGERKSNGESFRPVNDI